LKGNTRYLFVISQTVILILSLVTDYYIPLVLISLSTVFIMMLQKLGKGVVLRETIALHTCFICLVMPSLGYTVYTRANYFGFWIKYMPVPEDVYFGFTLPATTAFIIALCWPLNNESGADSGPSLMKKMNECRTILAKPYMKKSSLWILAIGVAMFFISEFLPVELQFIFILFFFSAFAGFLYVYFSPSFKFKWLVLSFFGLFIFYNAIRTGMFTIVAYMGITLFSFFFFGFRASLLSKVGVFCLGAFCLLIIQNVKPQFRTSTWKQEYSGNKTELFFDLMSQQVAKKSMFSPAAYYQIYYRTNQGHNIGLVMQRIPQVQPHDEGKSLLTSFASAFVPRFLWPDKPEAGGKFNMKYYAGVTIMGWSTNVGPLGEAYGSFGRNGGIIFMFFLGVFIRFCYQLVFNISKRVPLIIFWIPVLFYQCTYSAETDCLQIFNSLIKSAFFLWMMYKILPIWFGIKKEKYFASTKKSYALKPQ
jgi:hypothetical protein